MQGCPMRCQYCHNPDTWATRGGLEISANEILEQLEKNRSFYKNGGITATGGEPLLQIDFVIELFEKAKERKIHTCLDTSGITFQPANLKYLEKLNRLLAATDLVLLDLKHINSSVHKKITGHKNEPILLFARYLEEKGIPVWIRHVVVPTITDKPEDLEELGCFIGSLKNVKALDVLPYHTMGKAKYEQLGFEYPLEDLPECTKEEARTAKSFIIKGIRKQFTK